MPVSTKIVLTLMLVGVFLTFPARALLQQQPQSGETKRRILWVDRQGSGQPLAAPARGYGLPRLSPDGQRVVVDVGGPKFDIWVYDIPSGSLTKVTSDGNSRFPLWSPDGKRIAFGSGMGGAVNVFWKAADGSGEPERLTTSEHPHGPQSFTPDGKILSFYEIHPTTSRDIWILPLTGERKPWIYLRTPALEGGAVFSPDARWLAYSSDHTGRREIYVQPFPGPGDRQQISNEGGVEPMWARNGQELFYRIGDKMVAVDITTQPTFSAGKPRVLFEAPYQRSPGTRANYDVSADGQKFLMLKAVE